LQGSPMPDFPCVPPKVTQHALDGKWGTDGVLSFFYTAPNKDWNDKK
jgi:hypothetical protein